MKLVTNVMVNWREMEGDSDELKKLNSLLTSALIGNRDVPADECISHAQVIMGFWLSGASDWMAQAEKYLKTMFATGQNQKGESVDLPSQAKIVTDLMPRVHALFYRGRWPDRPVSV